MQNLETLELVDCENVTDEGIKSILKNMPNLRTLNLSGLKITDEVLKDLENMQNLETLYLKYCHNITPEVLLSAIENMPSLVAVNLRRCDKITSESIKIMEEKLPNISFTEDNGIIPQLKTESPELSNDESNLDVGYDSDEEENDSSLLYKSSNLFTIENIQNWVNSYKENPHSFNFKSVIESYLTSERQKLIDAFKLSTEGDNSLEKINTLNALETIKNTELTQDEYQHFVLGRLVYRASVTDESEVMEYRDLFMNFIKLLDDQGIDFKADLNNNPSDGITNAESFFADISDYQGKFWLSTLLKDYLDSKDDEGYDSENEEDSPLYAALHPGKYHTPDEIGHENDVHVEGLDDDHVFNDEII